MGILSQNVEWNIAPEYVLGKTYNSIYNLDIYNKKWLKWIIFLGLCNVYFFDNWML